MTAVSGPVTAYTDITRFLMPTRKCSGGRVPNFHHAWKTKCITKANTNKYAATTPKRFQPCFDFRPPEPRSDPAKESVRHDDEGIATTLATRRKE